MEPKVKEALETISKELEHAKITGNRHIMVLDKGWIFVGNLSGNGDGTFSLTHVHNLRKWEKGGFGLAVLDPSKAQVTLDPCGDIDFREASMIFCVPIPENWGK